MAPVRSDYGIKRYIDETKRLYSVLESRLSHADWLVGDKYTLADMANFSWVRAGPLILDFDISEWPGVEKWAKRIEATDAFKRAKNIPQTTMTDEQMIELFKSKRAQMDARENTDKH
jgi:glutathione S-transferase